VRLLLDSHTVIWAVNDPASLGSVARAALEDASNQLVVSTATIWEISIKAGLKKLDLKRPYEEWMDQAIIDLELEEMPITIAYANRQANLPWHHRDPFDRMLVAQALTEKITVVSVDAVLDQYGVTRIW
jgi:PIN domain nuclease of toxin-antitoxin system